MFSTVHSTLQWSFQRYLCSEKVLRCGLAVKVPLWLCLGLSCLPFLTDWRMYCFITATRNQLFLLLVNFFFWPFIPKRAFASGNCCDTNETWSCSSNQSGNQSSRKVSYLRSYSKQWKFGSSIYSGDDGYVKFLTKTDWYSIDDRTFYPSGQLWLGRKDIVGKIKGHMLSFTPLPCSWFDLDTFHTSAWCLFGWALLRH